jgi:hypothetical protein
MLWNRCDHREFGPTPATDALWERHVITRDGEPPCQSSASMKRSPDATVRPFIRPLLLVRCGQRSVFRIDNEDSQ